MLAKSDLPRHADTAALENTVGASTLRSGGTDVLLERLAQEVEQRASESGDEGAIVTSLRQLHAIEALSESLASSASALEQMPLEAALVDMKSALCLVGQILGVDGGLSVQRPMPSFSAIYGTK